MRNLWWHNTACGVLAVSAISFSLITLMRIYYDKGESNAAIFFMFMSVLGIKILDWRRSWLLK